MNEIERTGKEINDLLRAGTDATIHSFIAKHISINLYQTAGDALSVANFQPHIQLDQNAPMPPSPFSYSAYIEFRDFGGSKPARPTYDPVSHIITIWQDIKNIQYFIDTVQNSKRVEVLYYESGTSFNASIIGLNM